MSNNFSAVDGRNSGAQIQVITKGGTNQLHGSGSYYFQNDALSAKNVFETAVPDFYKHQFGYSVGGPIVRNRIFFFTSYEGLRQSGGRGSSFTVETPAFRDFVLQTRPDSIAARLFRDFAPGANPTSNFRDLGSPVPGQSAIGPPDGILDVGSAFYVPNAWRQGNQFNARVDYEVSPGKDRLYGSGYRTTSYTVNGGIRPAFDVPVLETTHFANVNHTHIFSPTKLNELRGGMMRLVGTPDTPSHLEIRASPSPKSPVRHVELPARMVADQLALQGHLHDVVVGSHLEDGRRTPSHVRIGGEHHELRPRLYLLQRAEFRERPGAADDPLRRSAHRRTGHRVFGIASDGMGHLPQRRLEVTRNSRSMPACATRTTARSSTRTARFEI